MRISTLYPVVAMFSVSMPPLLATPSHANVPYAMQQPACGRNLSRLANNDGQGRDIGICGETRKTDIRSNGRNDCSYRVSPQGSHSTCSVLEKRGMPLGIATADYGEGREPINLRSGSDDYFDGSGSQGRSRANGSVAHGLTVGRFSERTQPYVISVSPAALNEDGDTRLAITITKNSPSVTQAAFAKQLAGEDFLLSSVQANRFMAPMDPQCKVTDKKSMQGLFSDEARSEMTCKLRLTPRNASTIIVTVARAAICKPVNWEMSWWAEADGAEQGQREIGTIPCGPKGQFQYEHRSIPRGQHS